MTTINLGKIKPLYKGTYTGGVTYRPLDFTLYSGNLYVCKASSTGNLPTDPAYFDPVVSVNAASLPNTPAGSISATTVQAAINELDAEKVAKTDVIAIANGGTGATSANAAADALGAYRKGTILGPVSQSAGVPTGAVIERGSNANGEYVRYADGTQICTKSAAVNAVIEPGGFVRVSWVKPANFAGPAPTVVGNCVFLTNTGGTGGQLYGNQFGYGEPLFINTGISSADAGASFSIGPYTANSYVLTLLAVGRWF